MSELGDYLKRRRTDMDMSLRDFAAIIGISHTHLDSIEKGYDYRSKKAVSISMDTIEKIADGLNLDIFYVVSMATGRKQPFPNHPGKLDSSPEVSPADLDLLRELKSLPQDEQSDLEKYIHVKADIAEHVKKTAN